MRTMLLSAAAHDPTARSFYPAEQRRTAGTFLLIVLLVLGACGGERPATPPPMVRWQDDPTEGGRRVAAIGRAPAQPGGEPFTKHTALRDGTRALTATLRSLLTTAVVDAVALSSVPELASHARAEVERALTDLQLDEVRIIDRELRPDGELRLRVMPLSTDLSGALAKARLAGEQAMRRYDAAIRASGNDPALLLRRMEERLKCLGFASGIDTTSHP